MLAMLRAWTRPSSLLWLLSVLLPLGASARAEAPAPSQALASDPDRPRPIVGLGVDGAAMILGDFAARLDVALVPALSAHLTLGVSRRLGTDDALLEAGLTAWVLGDGMEGPLVGAVVGLAWAGPWTGEDRLVVRAGGEAGWQFLWGSLSITLAGGAHAAFLSGEGAGPAPEARARAALGVVL
jgi:hypothetical protein